MPRAQTHPNRTRRRLIGAFGDQLRRRGRSAVSLTPAVSHVTASAMCAIWLGCWCWGWSVWRQASASAEAPCEGGRAIRVDRLLRLHAAEVSRRPRRARIRRRPCLSHFPQTATGAVGQRVRFERVADGRWIAATALGGGDPIGVQSVRDRGQAAAGRPLPPDPLDRFSAQPRRCALASRAASSPSAWQGRARLAATSAFASPCSNSRSACPTPGRSRSCAARAASFRRAG